MGSENNDAEPVIGNWPQTEIKRAEKRELQTAKQEPPTWALGRSQVARRKESYYLRGSRAALKQAQLVEEGRNVHRRGGKVNSVSQSVALKAGVSPPD